MSAKPRAADIEIVERHGPGTPDPAEVGYSVICPTEVRVNGMPLLITEDGPTIESIELGSGGDRTVRVTMTVFARRVRIGTEEIIEVLPQAEGLQL